MVYVGERPNPPDCDSGFRQFESGHTPFCQNYTENGMVLTHEVMKTPKKNISDKLKGKSNGTPEGAKKGGLVATHNRWHVARFIIKDDCEYCQLLVPL